MKHRRRDSSFRRAFTLLEVMVAIGAVALISIGLARIFGATSQTLRAGRRLSHFNDYARMLERIMREDFSRMTRRGFLVIAHEQTQNPVYRGNLDSRIPAGMFANAPLDPRYRRRRIDQIMFFEVGDIRTQRTPLHPDRVASGAEAVVYYGHGLRQEPGSPIAVPALDDPNRTGVNTDAGDETDEAPTFGQPGPNEFAADWILLRHLSVLAQPKAKAPPRDPSLTFPTSAQWEDNPLQVDLAPAQSSIFRNMARGTPGTLSSSGQIARPGDGAVARPLVSSGLVDVIVGNLSTIRSIILDAQPIQSGNPPVDFIDDPTAGVLWADNDIAADTSTVDANCDGQPDDTDGNGRIDAADQKTSAYAFTPDLTPDGRVSCRRMKQWMLEALPAEPREQVGTSGVTPFPAASPDHGGRIRCELAPPDYLGTLASNGSVNTGDQDYRRTDQVMLTASNFAPACTEFIVEWSFGETYRVDTSGANTDPFLSGQSDPRGNQIIWHGLARYSETDFDSGRTLDQNDLIAGPYYGKLDNNTPAAASGNTLPRDAYLQAVTLTTGATAAWRVKSHVVHEPVDAQGLPDPQAGKPFYSLFGYVDPTFPGPTCAAPTAPDTIPCAWPRLIRVTITLADPADPSFEQTYQFIFEVPDDSRE